MTVKPCPSVFLLVITMTLVVTGARSQCSTFWQPGDGILGADSFVNAAIAWDPDGAGPLPELLVVGGPFQQIANVIGHGVATFQPATDTWSPLGDGFGLGRVNDFCVLPGGELLAGGFGLSPTGTALSLARWDGVVWQPEAAGLTWEVTHLVSLPGGAVLAAGQNGALWRFDSMAGSWTTLLPIGSTYIDAMVLLPNGEVAISTHVPLGNSFALWRWNGASLSPLAGSLNGIVRTLRVLPSGELLACGSFTVIDGLPIPYLGRWDGTNWRALAPGLNAYCVGEVMANGDVVVSGPFTAVGAVPANNIARWDGSSWSALGVGIGGTASHLTALSSGELFATRGSGYGSLSSAGGIACSFIARFDGAAWPPLGGTAPDLRVRDIAALPDGDVVAVGSFQNVGPQPADRIARRHLGTWSAIGPAWPGSFSPQVVIGLSDGDLLVGGSYGLRRWSGAAWTVTTFGPWFTVFGLLELANGDILAGGGQGPIGPPPSGIMRWNGASWLPFGGSGVIGVGPMVEMPNGDIVAGGVLHAMGVSGTVDVARWNGSAWSSMQSGLGSGGNIAVRSLVLAPDGQLFAGGQGFVPSRWDGAAWQPLGSGPDHNAFDMALLPNGDLVAGGARLYGTSPDVQLSRWNGSSWQPLANVSGVVDTVEAVAMLATGELAIAGPFLFVNGEPSPYFARLATDCPAEVTGYGMGCIGSAGPVQLTVDAAAWLGGTMRTTTTGVPNGALAVGVGGLQPAATSLSELLAPALPGCELLASTDALYLLVPHNGEVTTEIPIPAASLYLHKQFFHQVVVLELDPVGSLLAATSSNAVELLVGQF